MLKDPEDFFASHKQKNQPEINKSPTEKHYTLMFIDIFKDKLYFCLKGGQKEIWFIHWC